METEAKYYVPEISEFFVGFEYEIIYEDEPPKAYKFDITDMLYAQSPETEEFFGGICSKIENKQVRVKYLDSEDIESLGFKLIFSDIGIECWKLGNFELRTDVDLGAYIDSDNLYSIFYNPYGKQYNCVFSGIIKNKSKLKQVLKMIGVH